MKIGWIICLLFFFVSCQDQTTPTSEEMIVELDEMAQLARKSTSYPYFTNKMMQRMAYQLKGKPFEMSPGAYLDYLLVLIMHGSNQECIDLCEEFIGIENNNYAITDKNLFLYKILALAYLRRAEQVNCISSHNAKACIVPFAEEAVHKDQSATLVSANIYHALMQFDSADYQSQWFYNVTNMALGNYPDKMDSKFLIPESAFASEAPFKHFDNIAIDAKVAVNDHAGGASIADYNNDGLLDIFTTSYSLNDPTHLFINRGNGKFKDSTKAFGIDGMKGGLNLVHADFNNDGWMDVYIMRGAWLGKGGKIPNSLLINVEGEYFDDRTKSAGLYSKEPTGAVAVADIDLDGDIDIFVGNESASQIDQNPCRLFINNGDGTFDDQAEKHGLDVIDFVKGATWGDMNNDGFPELYLSIYGNANHLYKNNYSQNNPDQLFENIADSAGVKNPAFSFTTWFFDYNQDGLEDIFVYEYNNSESFLIPEKIVRQKLFGTKEGAIPRLYENQGNGKFIDVAEERNIDDVIYAMGGNFGDMNGDGYPDVFSGTGEFNMWASVPNIVHLNDGGLHFYDVTDTGGFGVIQKGHGVSFGDLDNDGDQDIYHQVGGAATSDIFKNMLFKNPGFETNFIALDLIGKDCNALAIGARLQVNVSNSSQQTSRTIYHTINAGGSFGQNALRATIGIGQNDLVNKITITWPDKNQTQSTYSNVSINKHYTATQGDDYLEKSEKKQVNF